MKNIGIISPANNVLKIFPNRMETGIKNLKEIGFNTILTENALRNNNYSRNSVKERVNEINEMIDSDVDLIMASIGGYTSIQILKYINYEKIKENNITFCGYSDITALLLAIYVKTKKIMLYGPTYTVNFCDYGGIDEYTKKSFLECLEKKDIEYFPSTYTINEFIDWNELEKSYREKEKIQKGYDWVIVKSGICEGKLIGGNLCTMLLTLGTEFLPVDIFDNSILFLEDCNTNINEFCSRMESLKLKGIFDKVNGIIIGKFDTKEMNDNIIEFLKDFFSDYNKPIIANIDFGHVFPIMTLPIGATANLDCSKEKVKLTVKF